MYFVAELCKYIGYSIIISFLIYFLSFSFLLYLNGRELKEYFLLWFGKMTKYDVFYLLILSIVTSIFICLSCYPNICINAKKKEYQFNQVGKEQERQDKGFTLNLNLTINKTETSKQNVDINTKEETTTKSSFEKPNFR
jgi:hypothetical protein